MRTMFLSHILSILMIFQSSLAHVTTMSSDIKSSSLEESREKTVVPPSSNLTVNLSTATGKTILFKTHDEDQDARTEILNNEIPHLVLSRNGVPTPGFERTLTVSVGNLAVPKSGMYVHLILETQHGDPDLDRRNNIRIQVRKETSFVPYNALTQQGVGVQFNVTFDPITRLPHKTIKTPTDYYRYRVVVSDALGNQLQTYVGRYAFLMENQWRVPLPKVLEAIPGAAPDELLVYYYDMVPFQTNLRDPDSQIPRQEVDRYIQRELIPAMVEAFQLQSNTWEFPWYEEWRNYRREEAPKTISVALGEYRIWFHGESPSLGHAMISIRVDGSVGEYDNMTDGLMSVFHHELFHNHQRNISLHFGKHAAVAGKEEAWMMFSEGTAVLASSVGQPNVQFGQTSTPRSYLRRAHAFIGAEGAFGGGLNKSYEKIPYQTALYWRFLYEKCGGLDNGKENPAAGMNVIRTTLETLYKGEIVDINSSTEMIESLPLIMDQVLATTPSCPFQSYKDSLSQFARTIYMLRLEDGRCLAPGRNDQCGFYDPNKLYSNPPIEPALISAKPITFISGNIPTSYGIDFIDLEIDPALKNTPLEIVFDKSSNSTAEYTLKFWAIKMPENPSQGPHPIAESEVLDAENGHFIFNIGSIKTTEYDRIGLIITRTDSQEKQDDSGAYTVQVLMK